MTAFFLILKKEFRQIFRDPAILRLIFLMPVLQLIILPFAADYEVKNVKVGVIDLDHSDYSRSLITKFENSSYFKLAVYSSDHRQALKWLEKEEADLVIEIPPRFESTLIRENSARLCNLWSMRSMGPRATWVLPIHPGSYSNLTRKSEKTGLNFRGSILSRLLLWSRSASTILTAITRGLWCPVFWLFN